MDQVRLQTFETDVIMPDRIVMGTAVTPGEALLFLNTAPDAAFLRGKAAERGIDLKGYEIAAAELHIAKFSDVPVDEMETDMASKAGWILGEQYVEGTLMISLIPMGKTGAQYGPTTFEFGTTVGWGYGKTP